MTDRPPWHVYIVRCNDDSLYTGIARDLSGRIHAHNHGSAGAKYTRARRPVSLVYSEPAPDRSSALRREHAIRRLPRARKLQLIAETGPAAR
jgi:putative endonuclease